MNNEHPIILALYPNARGLGYACVNVVEKKLLEQGIANIRPVANGGIIERIKQFIEYHNPTVIVIRDAKGTTSKNIERLYELNTFITLYAKHKHIPVYRYTRRQIRDVFELFGATTKEQIAKQLILWFKELAPFAPRIRKAWMDEDYHMGIFDAMSLVITHQYLNK